MVRLFKCLLTAFCVCSCFGGLALAQDVSEAKKDFLASNPNSGWTFGFLDRDSNFVAYNTTFSIDENTVGWCRDGMPGLFGDVTINFSDGIVDKFGVAWEPGLLTVNPGMDCQAVVIRWSAPAAGKIKVSGNVKNLVRCGGKTTVSITKNGSVLDQSDVAGVGFSDMVSEEAGKELPNAEAIPSSADLLADITVSKGASVDFVFTKESELGASHVGTDLRISTNAAGTEMSYNLNPKFKTATKVAAVPAKEVAR